MHPFFTLSTFQENVHVLIANLCRDRIRTSINIIGDSYGAGIVYHLSRQTLEEQDRLKAEQEAREKEGDDVEIDMTSANDREALLSLQPICTTSRNLSTVSSFRNHEDVGVSQ